ncbi:metallophosphoesterase family protein [Paenibacillus alvei]|uniref:metallophosphoesterase family protein n=1 Tax=Paenibacillus alvei TaxID=44250 RepID=UPI0022829FE6|nr:metallophosphoesterase family protein [Paenibacillus alvei]MCY9737429.1 metallophosphoesterase family protein [Paenibacillus alvei]
MKDQQVITTYTNSDGINIELTKEHLDKAVEVKIELQKASASLRCNWSKHKEIMNELGIKDSDTSENYRCIVKWYQKKIGLLTPVHRHMDLATERKLEAINRVLGDVYSEKRENQLTLQEINKIRKSFYLNKTIIEEIRDIYLDELVIDIPHYAHYPRVSSSENKAILVITDWHIGAKIDNVKGNSFNLKIAKKRIEKLKHETIEYCKMFNVNDLYVCCLGDAIEHVYMRNTNQAADSEINMSKQVVTATRYIFDLLVSLSEYVNVEYEGIGGNHDRSNGDKHANIDGDNMMVVINESIKDLVKLTNSKRLTFIDNDAYMNEIVKTVNGKKFKFVHGDEERNDLNAIKSHISMDGEFYDVLVKGHLHSFRVYEENDGRLVIQVGCLSGRNTYSKKLKCTTNAGQALIVVRGDGEIIPIKIDLQVN